MQNQKIKNRWTNTKYLTIALTKISEKKQIQRILEISFNINTIIIWFEKFHKFQKIPAVQKTTNTKKFKPYKKLINKKWRNISTNSSQKVEKTQILSSSSCSQCGLNSNLCICAYQLRQSLPKACHKEIARQTESNSREDKIPKFVGKTFFYFVSEAIQGENNTSNW